MADDGLSQEEMVKLLFKNYMNFGSSSHVKDYFEETVFENNTNIFSNEIMADRPTKTPAYTNASDAIVKSYLEKNDSNLYIDSSWVNSKVESHLYRNDKSCCGGSSITTLTILVLLFPMIIAPTNTAIPFSPGVLKRLSVDIADSMAP